MNMQIEEGGRGLAVFFLSYNRLRGMKKDERERTK